MPSRSSNNGGRPLPTYIPLNQAARISGLPVSVLRERITAGTMAAIRLADGAIAVSEHDTRRAMRKEDLPEYRKYAHLKGVRISISDASKAYGVSTQTISQWVKRGYIERLHREGRKVLVDEADVAYCAQIYRQRGGQGRWLFNPDGTPYMPKVGHTS